MKNYCEKIKQKLLNNEISKLANEAVLSFDRKRCSNATPIIMESLQKTYTINKFNKLYYLLYLFNVLLYNNYIRGFLWQNK